jgi:small subunit ribosomal protein S20e
MSDPKYDKTKEGVEEVEEDVLHFKLTLTHRQPQGLEKASSEILKKVTALTTEGGKIKCSGPGRMPTKHLNITTRKSPCGNGTNSYDHWEMRIHKRVFHIYSSQKNFQAIVSGVHTEPGMILEAEEIEE